jgi:hypothetical protein
VLDSSSLDPAATPAPRRRRRWLFLGVGVAAVLGAMTAVSALVDDGRYAWAGDICRRVVADPLGSIGLHETSRGPDRPANSDLGLTQCHVFVNDGDPAGNAQLLVGISVRPTEQDAAASYKLVWRQFNTDRFGSATDLSGLGDKAQFGRGKLGIQPALDGRNLDAFVVLRHHNLVLVVALHGTFDGDRARPVMIALAREVLAGTPR